MRRLSVSAFRSYASAQVDVAPRAVVLSGANGAGKTNLLEALSFLAPGRGLRRAPMTSVQNQTAPDSTWAVSATLDTEDGQRKVGTGRDPDRNGDLASERRIIRIDGVPVKSQGDLAAIGAVSWLTPDMDGLFTGPASERRRFLDRMVYGFFPSHAAQLSAYDKAMRDRSRLLRDGTTDSAWLDALEAAMAEKGIAVAAARAEFVGRMATACADRVSAFPMPALALTGDAEALAAEAPALIAEQALREKIGASRRLDAEAGRALVGPHRADLDVTYAAKEMPAALCSTGEQKALLISLILAAARLQRIERKAAPLLLLDEIGAHLDADRRASLFDEIEGLGAQAWITGTDAGLFDALQHRATFIAVDDGRLTITHLPDDAA